MKLLDRGCRRCHCLAKSSLYRRATLFVYDSLKEEVPTLKQTLTLILTQTQIQAKYNPNSNHTQFIPAIRLCITSLRAYRANILATNHRDGNSLQGQLVDLPTMVLMPQEDQSILCICLKRLMYVCQNWCNSQLYGFESFYRVKARWHQNLGFSMYYVTEQHDYCVIGIKCSTARTVLLPRDAMHKRCLCCRPVSVRPSVTLMHCIHTAEISPNFFLAQ